MEPYKFRNMINRRIEEFRNDLNNQIRNIMQENKWKQGE